MAKSYQAVCQQDECMWQSTPSPSEAEATGQATFHAEATGHGVNVEETSDEPQGQGEGDGEEVTTAQDATPVPEEAGTDLATDATLPSLAPDGTGKYYPVNLRMYHPTSMRVQVQRPGHHYMSEHDIPAPAEFLAWLAQQPHTSPSMAGSHTKYVRGQVRVVGDSLRFQIAGTPLNRPYGAAFTLFNGPVLTYLTQ